MNAVYFDGIDARRHAVQLAVDGPTLSVRGDGVTHDYAVASVRLAEPSAHAPALLYLPDGALCEVHGDARAALAAALAYCAPWAVRLHRHASIAVLALALLVAVAGLAGWRLFPALASWSVHAVPARIDQRLGAWAMEQLQEEAALQPSRIAPALAGQVTQTLALVAPAHPRVPLRLRIFHAPRIGINALALPDGTIVLTDQLIWSLNGASPALNVYQQTALAGILAHEIGHLEARDGVRALIGRSLTAVLSAVLFGDFSEGISAFSSNLVGLHYAREKEAAADGWAIARMREVGLPLAPLAEWFAMCDAWYAGMDGGKRRAAPVYFNTHPATPDRVARLRAADGH